LHSLDTITVEGLPTDIPSVIEVDVSGLEQIDATIYVSDLSVPGGVTLLTDPERVVAKVAPPHVEKEVEEEVPEEEVPEEEAKEAEEPAAEGEEGEG
jgi:large subunit ribosomal protein L25